MVIIVYNGNIWKSILFFCSAELSYRSLRKKQDTLTDRTPDDTIEVPVVYGANFIPLCILRGAVSVSDKTQLLMKSKLRVQQHGEVFTPDWVVSKMLDTPGIAEKARDIFATFLEPSAGEGAFLLAIENQKLTAVSLAHDGDSWNDHALWALTSIYGIELLEDNLETARQSMLDLFSDYYKSVHGKAISKRSGIYRSAKTIIEANIVQGNTLTRKNKEGNEIVFSRWKLVEQSLELVQRKVFPYSFLFGEDDVADEGLQIDMFDSLTTLAQAEPACEGYAICRIDAVWKEEKDMTERKATKFKFDVVIGNPPYQEEMERTSDKPIYNLFMDEAYKIAQIATFITPARFLFNVGKTPKPWNRKMLEDEHLKVTYYEQDSSKVFTNTDIKGGVAITYRDAQSICGSIGKFSAYPALSKIAKTVQSKTKMSFSSIIYGQNIYQYTDILHNEYPNINEFMSKGHKYDVTSNAFSILGLIFLDSKPEDEHMYIKFLGLENNKRVYKWIRSEYISEHFSLEKYKVFLPKSNGSGVLGEALSRPVIGFPSTGATQTFLTIGCFDTEMEAKATYKYICSKFVRALLGVLKVTQDNTSAKWEYVPLQDFTANSDIDWSKSVKEIDRQLYKKYGLDEEEIAFIESNVKEMG